MKLIKKPPKNNNPNTTKTNQANTKNPKTNTNQKPNTKPKQTKKKATNNKPKTNQGQTSSLYCCIINSQTANEATITNGLSQEKKIIYQVLQDSILEAPQREGRVAWDKSFANKTVSLLLPSLTHNSSPPTA